MFNNDPRWDYIWTPRHQFFYDLLVDTKHGDVEWFSNRGGLFMPGQAYKYICMFKSKKIEITWDVQMGDAVLDRILTDIKTELNRGTYVEDLSYTDYSQKWDELNCKQSGLLSQKDKQKIIERINDGR